MQEFVKNIRKEIQSMERTLRVLVVEDSETQAFKMRLLLEKEGCEVSTVPTAEAALAELNQTVPDLIVVDYHLPGMDGRDLCRQIRMNLNSRGIPILMLTAADGAMAAMQGLESGADDYVSKFENPEILILRIRGLLRKARSQPAILNAQGTGFRRPRILAIDDSPTYLESIRLEMGSKGYDMETATDGQEGVERLAREDFDCVLIDLEMPRMDGIDVCRSINRTRDPADVPAALIMLTASHTEEDITRSLEAGADDFVTKATDMGILRVRIQALLRRRAFQEEYRRNIAERERVEQHAMKLRRLECDAAEAQAANRAKSTFLSTISHEIRTPMNAILGYAQLMMRDPSLGEDAKANLKIIGRSGEHLLGIINEVLDMSKIEAGRMELLPAVFNLPSLLNDLAAMFRLRAEAKALRFEMLMDGESAPYIVADEGKMRQALINLLGNAIKFTMRGQIKLHVTLLRRSGDRLWMSAHIEDTGSGISDEEQGKLFEPFSQTKAGLNTQEGTGLGLAISRKYARLMGGDITVTSSPGAGSIFQFEIPVERAVAGVAVRRSDPRRVIGIRAGPEAPRILVVDDQAGNRDWLMKLLTTIGFSVQGAETGGAAIASWEEWKPQLILMDVHMPGMDGLEATRKIKARPGGKETGVVVLTASAMEDDRRAAAQSGADDFLVKPCREEELLEKIRSFLHIVYDYEEISGAEGEPASTVTDLSGDRLGPLPLELIEEIRKATLTGNKKLLNKLILEVRDSGSGNADSARALQKLADKYEYDTLARLLEEACRR